MQVAQESYRTNELMISDIRQKRDEAEEAYRCACDECRALSDQLLPEAEVRAHVGEGPSFVFQVLDQSLYRRH